MKTMRDYSKLEGKEKKAAAIQDCIDYLGDERFNNLVLAIGKEIKTKEQLAFYCEFAGIQGYPVEAIWSKYGN